jgi:predicted nucleic acid-binding protein
MKKINKILLDTTYILPLFGIEIKIDPDSNEKLKMIWDRNLKDLKFYLSSVSLIETMYKLLGEYRKKENFEILNRYQMILPTILNSPIQIYNPELNAKASLIATKIRHFGHPDIMDCWIAATAALLKCSLLTEDSELEEILSLIPETKEIEIWSWSEFNEKFL